MSLHRPWLLHNSPHPSTVRTTDVFTYCTNCPTGFGVEEVAAALTLTLAAGVDTEDADEGTVKVWLDAPVAPECTCCGTKTNSKAAIARDFLIMLDLVICEERLFKVMAMVMVVVPVLVCRYVLVYMCYRYVDLECWSLIGGCRMSPIVSPIKE
jgi:hypothetical protein